MSQSSTRYRRSNRLIPPLLLAFTLLSSATLRAQITISTVDAGSGTTVTPSNWAPAGANPFLNNNGLTGFAFTTFNFTNTSVDPVQITTISSVTSSTTGTINTAELWMSSTPINQSLSGYQINAGNGWSMVATGTYSAVANSTTTVTQVMLSGLSVVIPGNTTVGLAFATTAQRYTTISGTPPTPPATIDFANGGCIMRHGTNVSWSGTMPSTTNTPRGFVGAITFVPLAACGGTPSAGSINGPSNICSGSSATLTLGGATFGTGMSYQWKSSATPGGPYTNVGTGISYNTGALTSTTYYVCESTCSNGGGTATSPEFTVSVTGAFGGGTFTIDNTLPTAGNNFNSFTAAINAVNAVASCGAITGPIVVNVTAGQTFNEKPPQITASGNPGNTITVQRSGPGANPVIVPTGTAGTTDAGITIHGGDHIIFDGIDVNASAATAVEYGYLVRNASATEGANNNTVRNCAITLNNTNTASIGLLHSSSTTGGGVTPTSAGGANNDCVYQNVSISNVRLGGVLVTSGSTTVNGVNNTVRDCTVGAPYVGLPTNDIGAASTSSVYGIQYLNQQDGQVFGNTVRNIGASGTDRGIWMNASKGTNNNVYRNRIHGIRNTLATGTSTQRGIEAALSSTGVHTMNVYNNMVSDITAAHNTTATGTRVITGIILGTGAAGSVYNVDHNSVSLDGSGSLTCSSVCLEWGGTTATNNGRNNVLANFTGTQTGLAKHYCVRSTSATAFGPAGSLSDFNVYHLPNHNNGFVGLTSTTDRVDVAAWSAALTGNPSTDLNTSGGNPGFDDPALDLHIDLATQGAIDLNNNGLTLAAITTDFDQETRDTPPDRGADEYVLVTCSGTPTSGTISAAAAPICQGQSTLLTLNGPTEGIGISYQWKSSTIPGGPYSNLGTELTQSTGVLTETTYYIVTVTCTVGGTFTADSPEFTLTVNQTPTASASSNSPVCAGQDLLLNGTTDAGTAFTWTGPQGFASTSEDPTITAAPLTASGIYTFTALLAGCASAPATTEVEIIAPPTIQSVTATPEPVCTGGNTQLNATALIDQPYVRFSEVTVFRTGTGATTTYPAYINASVNDFVELCNTSSLPADISGWTFGDYASNATATTHPLLTFPPGTVIPPNGKYVIGLGAAGASSPADQYIITGGGNDSWLSTSIMAVVLKNASNTVVDAAAYGAGYVFNPALGVTGADWSGSIASGGSRAGMIRTASVDNNTASDWVQSNTPSPLQTIGTFNAGYTNPDQGAPPTSYAWTPATFLNDATIANPLASGVTASTTYTVTIESAPGCSTSGTLTVNVTGAITAATVAGNLEFCDGGSTTLTATPSDGGPPFTYLWSPGGETTASITVSSSGTYSCLVNDACGGPGVTTPDAIVIENPLPVVTVDPTSAGYCSGNAPVQLAASGADSYTWSPATGLSATSGANVAASALISVTYTVTGTDANGCQNTATSAISYNGVAPNISSLTATPPTICAGSSSQLNVVATAPGYALGSGGTTWIDIAGTGTAISGISDDSEHNISMPAFTFNGITYTNARVGMNGVLVFGATAGEVTLTNATLPTGTITAGNAFLAPWWDDLDIQGGASILTETVGDLFIVQWNNVAHNAVTAGTNNIWFQIQMHLVTGQIWFVYQDVLWGNPSFDAAVSGTVGIQWANSAGNAILYSFNTASLSNGQVISFTPSSLAYTWSPAASLDNPSIANPLSTPASTTTYTVTVTAGACTSQGTTTVTSVPVDDGDPCTVDACENGVATHVYTDTDNDGVCDGLDGCPLDANKTAPGICGCGISDADTDSDGTADCNDGCPLDPLKTAPGICGCGVADTDTDSDGTADCNDGCPTDPAKIAPGLCGCFVPEGSCNDCEGTPSGPAQPGTPCDDNDACTINDLWSPSCVCAGTFQDTDGDTVCDADDICPGADDLLDTDGDAVVDCLDNCPLITGQIGTSCDDGDPNTIGDVVTATCVCAGTVPPCPDNLTILSLSTDQDSEQTSWDVIPQGGGAPVCSGAGLADNFTFAYNCCLPNGCYELRVFDSMGDGIANGTVGGYVLTQADGSKRIIDNSNDGIFTSLSSIANNLGFCVPLGNDGLIAINCDKTDWLTNDVMQATANPAVTTQFGVSNANSGYQFWFFNPDGGYSRRVLQTHAAPGPVTGPPANIRASYLRLSSLVTQPIPFYTNLNVRVRTQVAGTFSEWGPACRFRLDPPCNSTTLTTIPNPVTSCGATGLTLSSTIYATALTGATNYQFEFKRPGYLRRITVNTRSVALGFVTNPLQNNTCYNVRVRVSFDNGQTYCPFGASCTVTIGTALCPPPGMMLETETEETWADEQRLTLWPNPSDGTAVAVSFTDFDADLGTVIIDVTDAFGKLISSRTIPVQDGQLMTTLTFDEELAPGLYLVNLQAGEQRFTERLVIQR